MRHDAEIRDRLRLCNEELKELEAIIQNEMKGYDLSKDRIYIYLYTQKAKLDCTIAALEWVLNHE